MSRYAPILQEVAGRLCGQAPSLMRLDPVRWAYAVRDAVSLAQPDLVVSHYDESLEADAIHAAAGPGLHELPALAAVEPTARAVELVRVLAEIYATPGSPAVAATVTGPATVAARLCPLAPGVSEEELAELAADLLAPLVGAYARAGAAVAIVFSRAPSDERQIGPLRRAADHHRIELAVVDRNEWRPLPASTPPESLRRSAAGSDRTLANHHRRSGNR